MEGQARRGSAPRNRRIAGGFGGGLLHQRGLLSERLASPRDARALASGAKSCGGGRVRPRRTPEAGTEGSGENGDLALAPGPFYVHSRVEWPAGDDGVDQ